MTCDPGGQRCAARLIPALNSSMNINSPTPIFVLGYMHSGTTLLLEILSKNTAIFASKGETRFYEFLPIIMQTFPDLNNQQTLQEFLIFTLRNILFGDQIIRKQLSTQDIGLPATDINLLIQRAQSRLEHGRLLPLVFEYLAERAGKTFWLEKTPTHIFCVDQIVKHVPSAYFVEIVRDVRAVLASKKVRRATVWTDRYPAEQRSFKNLEKAYDPLWDTLSWKSAIKAGIFAKHNYPTRVLRIRYEDLVTDQEDTILRMCEFLSLRFEPMMLDVRTKNTAYFEESDFTGISDKFLNRWQVVLNPSEINFPQLFSRKEMQANSYNNVPTPFLSKLISIAYLLRSFSEFFLRLYRRYRLGGWQYLLSVVRNYLRRFIQLSRRPQSRSFHSGDSQ